MPRGCSPHARRVLSSLPGSGRVSRGVCLDGFVGASETLAPFQLLCDARPATFPRQGKARWPSTWVLGAETAGGLSRSQTVGSSSSLPVSCTGAAEGGRQSWHPVRERPSHRQLAQPQPRLPGHLPSPRLTFLLGISKRHLSSLRVC